MREGKLIVDPEGKVRFRGLADTLAKGEVLVAAQWQMDGRRWGCALPNYRKDAKREFGSDFERNSSIRKLDGFLSSVYESKWLT